MSNQCWSCQTEYSTETFICPSCNAMQACPDMDAFSRLGLEARFDLDFKSVEKAYVDKQKLFHPDRAVAKSKQERVFAAQHAAAVNQAYSTLKNPVLRAKALLKLNNQAPADIESQTLDDPVLLMEVMQLQEALLDVETPLDLMKLQNTLKQSQQKCLIDLSQAFANDDFDGASKFINRLSYFTKIANDAKMMKVG